MQRLELLASGLGKTISKIEPISNSGSNRRYYRLLMADGSSLVGVIGNCRSENEAFIYLDEYFAARSLNVPTIMAVSDDRMAYLQQDLGSECLLDHISDLNLVGAAIDMLPRFQLGRSLGLDFTKCYPVMEMDMRSVMWDLNYFKYCFLKLMGVEIDETQLENEFSDLANTILSARPLGFMIRDFQSRNIMIYDNEPWLIDFQGGRRGPVHYDVVSFLWQTRAGFSDELKDQMISRYASAAGLDEAQFRVALPEFITFRMMQVLGAYGFRGLYEKKPMFIQQIPAALENLAKSINAVRFPYLHHIAEELKAAMCKPQVHSGLTVEVLSFSYKRGLPIDRSGNGGGFVFDCRAVHNPGRYDRYKKLTGRDPEVIEFLESNGEISAFLGNCYELVDAAVERYLERGFTHLQVAFGCTGGRHRSLYSADHMASHLREKFANRELNVTLKHREQPQLT